MFLISQVQGGGEPEAAGGHGDRMAWTELHPLSSPFRPNKAIYGGLHFTATIDADVHCALASAFVLPVALVLINWVCSCVSFFLPSSTIMVSSTIAFALFAAASVVAQNSSSAVVCFAGQCLQGFSNTTSALLLDFARSTD